MGQKRCDLIVVQGIEQDQDHRFASRIGRFDILSMAATVSCDGYDRVKQGLNPRPSLGHSRHDAIDQEGRIGLDYGQGRARSIGELYRLAIKARGWAKIGCCRLPKPFGYVGQGLGTNALKLVWRGVRADLTDKIGFLAVTGVIGQHQVLTGRPANLKIRFCHGFQCLPQSSAGPRDGRLMVSQ